jgi:predicted dehydrogenase
MKKLKIGHIGWLSCDDGPDCETTAWCDINAEKMNRLKKEHPAITMYTDWREMVNHPGLDLVVISTPNWLHCEMACAFLEAGRHVFVEKPMGINRAEMDRLLLAVRKSGRNLAVDFEMRISPFASRIKQALDSAELGELRRIEMIHHRGGWVEEGNGLWRTRPEKSGGLFLMEPIHSIDICRFFAGEITAVQSFSGPNVLANYRFPDNACTHLFFKSGVQGTLLTTHTLSAHTNNPAKWPQLGHDMNMIFTCSKGTIAVDFLTARFLINRYEQYPAGAKGTRVVFDRAEDHSPGEDWHSFFHDINAMRRAFIRRCANNEPPVQDPEDAWKTHLVCLAAEDSATTDFRRIEMDYTLPK